MVSKQKNKAVIHLAKGLDVPLDITTQKTSLMGGNGSGKTYTTTKIVEEVLRADGWVIVLDPVGIYYGLRLNADGITPSGLDIPVFGGLHGDIILTPESGALIADLLCDRRLSAVLDVSQFTDSELNRFATDFGNRFWTRMKAQRRAVLLVFEECQEFMPQNPMKGEERKLHIYTRIAKLGRNYGIGVMLISQRPQDVNKKVFNLTQLMFAFQMTGTHERKSMAEWISYVGLDENFSDILPRLEVGEPFVASPRWLKVNEKFHILPKRTYDASATPDFEEDAETISLKPIDISALEKSMKGLIEETKANDPAELKREITRLKKELTAAQSAWNLFSQCQMVHMRSLWKPLLATTGRYFPSVLKRRNKEPIMLPLPTLDLKHPTDPANYVDRPFAKGTPLSWRDDVTGTVPAAVMAYLNQEASDEQIKMVIAYLQYHIHAPCWLETPPWGETDEEMAEEIRALRALSLKMSNVADVNQYIHSALDSALDPP